MCGIVGFYGKKESILDTLINGLKRLEYRGYDSSGIAIITQDHKVYHQKSVGKIASLESQVYSAAIPEFDCVGIAHTRWATHGIPTVENAHPHQSQDGKIWIAHNGIIENFKELKTSLQSEGVIFESQTDTEVIAKLLGKYYQGDLREAVFQVLHKIEGAYALAIISADEPNRLIGAKKGSPLVLGVADHEYILASDVSAIISKTRDVIYLEDNEVVDIKDGEYEITNLENEILSKGLEKIDWDEEAASKEGFDTFMAKEITEQVQSIKDSFRGRILLEDANVKFGGLLDVIDRLRNVEKVIVVGIGGSFFAAHLGEVYFEKLAGITAKAEMSSEMRYKNMVIDDKTWVIALSQSGETADTIGAIQEAKRRGALVTGIVNSVGSTISRITDAGVYNHIGPEISVASTKATTSQYLILLMHAILLGRLKNLGFSQSSEILEDILKLPDYIKTVISSWPQIKTISQKYYTASSFIFFGRRLNYPISREGAIKLKEISYIHAESFSGGELKHGPIAMIDKSLPTIAICNQDDLYEKQISSIQEVLARSGPVIAVADIGDQNLPELVDDVIFVPKASTEEVQAIINAIPLQIFAYECALLKGLDIDKPRNLAKSVTVE
ncbi:MAG: glutamine--fructose-6-phosphate transaminase (isomerizing) [bacterium]